MTNHVHLLATPDTNFGISRMMQYQGRCYVRYFNRMYGRTGTLWEGRFKSCVVDSEVYFITCQKYIELNPVRARMVDKPDKYRWSSFNVHGHGIKCPLTTISETYLSLSSTGEGRRQAYRNLFESETNEMLLSELRTATHKSLAFGTDKFKEQFEVLYKRRVRSQKPGPKVGLN